MTRLDDLVTKRCVGCGAVTTGMCWADCGMSLCGAPLCSRCHHVDEKYGWMHEPRALIAQEDNTMKDAKP
jgi:hypothetical protein